MAKNQEKKKTAEEKKPEEKKTEEKSCFINREISWLEFNRRVLLEAADVDLPLIERLKFLAIYRSNMDEFFMVRVGILTHRAELSPEHEDHLSGWTPQEEIDHVLEVVRSQQSMEKSVWNGIKEKLKEAGVDVLDFKKISKVDELMCKKLFREIRSELSPRLLYPGQPFPFLRNEQSCVIAKLGKGKNARLGLVPIDHLPAYQVFEIDGRQKVVMTDTLIRHFISMLFKKMEVTESAVMRVTRNADVFISKKVESADGGFREHMQNALRVRDRQKPVRLQLIGKVSDELKAELASQLGISTDRIFTSSIPYSLSFWKALRKEKDFFYEDRKPSQKKRLKKGEYSKAISEKDMLLSYPFQSMLPFIDLLYEAADDPEVESIQITLYRVSSNSKVAAALVYAADQGKNVMCLLELQARFDEQNNIDYAAVLEEAGCKVIYGKLGMKVHSKLCLITRRVNGKPSYITQVGTGNYNEVTSEQYTDLSLITADENVGKDASTIFQALGMGDIPPKTEHLLMAPLCFKSWVLEYLDREKEKGEKGRVHFKVNSLNNVDVMNKLIECSKAGVKIELDIRGICCLRPGVKGLTENITVRSTIGRWLEHSRIYSFGEGKEARIIIGSGDLMNRNLERRVEGFIEVKDPDAKKQVQKILDTLSKDGEQAWVMSPKGTYGRQRNGDGTIRQEELYQYFSAMTAKQKKIEKKQPEEKKKVQKKGFFSRFFGR
jgi:polyphosphate kinase